MKILNLYAGIGGNRKLWGDNHQITAVEKNEKIAKIYHDYFPADNIIITDAHQFLLDHYREFDFIWSSPPCPSHSRTQLMSVLSNSIKSGCQNRKSIYPDMSLYQEIIILQNFAPKKCYWVIENVIPYYNFLINPSIILGRHAVWSNFLIEEKKIYDKNEKINSVKTNSTRYGYNLQKYGIESKRKILRNLVNPEIGRHILDIVEALNKGKKIKQNDLFANII